MSDRHSDSWVPTERRCSLDRLLSLRTENCIPRFLQRGVRGDLKPSDESPSIPLLTKGDVEHIVDPLVRRGVPCGRVEPVRGVSESKKGGDVKRNNGSSAKLFVSSVPIM